MLRGEATNTNFIVFGFTWSGIEPTIYQTQGEHANHYTINEVDMDREVAKIQSSSMTTEKFPNYMSITVFVDKRLSNFPLFFSYKTIIWKQLSWSQFKSDFDKKNYKQKQNLMLFNTTISI
jgi:hypothetical protein